MSINQIHIRRLIAGLAAVFAVGGFVVILNLNAGPDDQPNQVTIASAKTAKPQAARPKPPVRHPVSGKQAAYRAPDKIIDNGPEVYFPAPTKNTIQIPGEGNKSVFQKLDSYRNPIGADANHWDCVIDLTNNLVWEVKTSDKGLRDENNYYSWFSPDETLNGGDPGRPDNGYCLGGSKCDTQSYIDKINASRLCGFSDWRLPTKSELMTLVIAQHKSNKPGLLDIQYFPRAASDWYWSSDTDADDPTYAWFVLFYNGKAMKASKHLAKRIRLVRGGTKPRSFKDVADKKEGGENNNFANERYEPQSNTVSPELLSLR